ncbi:hypothetical protein NL676_007698 [Syzygium grande]|nr:hypothetical protein NL676_007698 [Syzygium grande]
MEVDLDTLLAAPNCTPATAPEFDPATKPASTLSFTTPFTGGTQIAAKSLCSAVFPLRLTLQVSKLPCKAGASSIIARGSGVFAPKITSFLAFHRDQRITATSSKDGASGTGQQPRLYRVSRLSRLRELHILRCSDLQSLPELPCTVDVFRDSVE